MCPQVAHSLNGKQGLWLATNRLPLAMGWRTKVRSQTLSMGAILRPPLSPLRGLLRGTLYVEQLSAVLLILNYKTAPVVGVLE
jgi:hypothetical protein